MVVPQFLFSDGKYLKQDKLLISPNNRSFRYGDGFFETMKWHKGKILLEQLHMERLFATLNTLHFKPPAYFTTDYIVDAVQQLVAKNQHHQLARVRVTIYRGDGGIYDEQNHFPHLLIQTWALNPMNNRLNENGLEIDIYAAAVKHADHFSLLKSNNYLGYAMAAIWAKEHHLNDAILLNPQGNIADATIANIFLITNGTILTPTLSEGPVAGVMRRFVLKQLNAKGYEVKEGIVTVADLANASEVFLTNAIYGMRWVKQCGKRSYAHQLVPHLYKEIIAGMF
ncbi:aminotransferase class IV [Sediminibacterium sp.]|uniref:aminotransferase class IV n=1 Tax=Sediminibacterium sp. TaxID=1917865 RepID=UPI003F72EF7F